MDDTANLTRGVRYLTFDCYGTLVDWETGILRTLGPLLRARGAEPAPGRILEWYAAFEAEEERGPWRPYRQVLGRVTERVLEAAGVPLSPGDAKDREALADGLPDWPVFADTPDALARLRHRFGLVVVSNVDDDLFRGTARHLGVELHHVVTAEQAGAYKPDPRPFLLARERLGVGRDEILHVAQSLYHDHAPVAELGWRRVRVNRPSRLPGRGVALPVDVSPQVEVPDLASLADLLGA